MAMTLMHDLLTEPSPLPECPPDDELVARIQAGEVRLFETLMRRHNQRLFRMLRALLRHDAEAEDVMQEAYVRAFAHLGDFAGRASFSTWLLRIAANEAMARLRRGRRFLSAAVDIGDEEAEMVLSALASPERNPEDQAGTAELRSLLTEVIDALPERYRAVFVLREVEGLSTAETAEALELTAENVKVRLHRARALLRAALDRRLGGEMRQVFRFDGPHCDRVVAAVLGRLGIGD
jgi:RNA polymerase sigma-70 factor (ECF subfamily)